MVTSARSWSQVSGLGWTPTMLMAGIGLFAASHLGLAAFMAFDPHDFYRRIGPFGLRNDHYIRDVATYNAAIGVALAVSLRKTSWRVPVLALVTLQFALHSINHLVDIDKAHPSWTGYFDFGSLAAATLLLLALWRVADAEKSAERRP